jgi:hypothetical protein
VYVQVVSVNESGVVLCVAALPPPAMCMQRRAADTDYVVFRDELCVYQFLLSVTLNIQYFDPVILRVIYFGTCSDLFLFLDTLCFSNQLILLSNFLQQHLKENNS